MSKHLMTALLAALLTLGTAPALAGGGCGGKGSGSGGSCACECGCGTAMHGPGKLPLRGALKKLDLEEGQVDELIEIRQGLRSQHAGVHGKMQKLHWRIDQALAAEQPDPEQVSELYGELFDLRQRMIQDRVSARNELRAALSEEQWQKLQDRNCGDGTCKRGQGRR
jgi:Spy/CpxP family protein refolding chaperone